MENSKEVDDSTSSSCVANKCGTGPEDEAVGRDSLHQTRAIDMLVEEIGLYALSKGENWRTGEGAAIMNAYEVLTNKT